MNGNLLITGGRSDIARAIALRSKTQFDNVFTTATGPTSQGENENWFRASGTTGASFAYCFENPDPHFLLEQVAPLSALVLNAHPKWTNLGTLTEQDPQTVMDHLSQVVAGNLRLVQAALPFFQEQKFGRIVLVSSLSVELGIAGYSGYIMAKAALEALMRSIAVEYGCDNIRANTLRLGIVSTSRHGDDPRKEKIHQRLTRMIPAGTLGRPEEVAEAVAPLLAKHCYVNGETIRVAGGWPCSSLKGAATFQP